VTGAWPHIPTLCGANGRQASATGTPQPLARYFADHPAAIQVDIMRTLALFLLVVVLLWAVDEVAFDGRNGAQLYQEAHHQGQKLKVEVKNRLNTDKT
jgi:hypothetical protein